MKNVFSSHFLRMDGCASLPVTQTINIFSKIYTILQPRTAEASLSLCLKRIGINRVKHSGDGGITMAKLSAVGKECKAIFWTILGLKDRTLDSHGFSEVGALISVSALPYQGIYTVHAPFITDFYYMCCTDHYICTDSLHVTTIMTVSNHSQVTSLTSIALLSWCFEPSPTINDPWQSYVW